MFSRLHRRDLVLLALAVVWKELKTKFWSFNWVTPFILKQAPPSFMHLLLIRNASESFTIKWAPRRGGQLEKMRNISMSSESSWLSRNYLKTFTYKEEYAMIDILYAVIWFCKSSELSKKHNSLKLMLKRKI